MMTAADVLTKHGGIGRPRTYPWDEWLRQAWVSAMKGYEYKVEDASFRSAVRMHARDHGLCHSISSYTRNVTAFGLWRPEQIGVWAMYTLPIGTDLRTPEGITPNQWWHVQDRTHGATRMIGKARTAANILDELWPRLSDRVRLNEEVRERVVELSAVHAQMMRECPISADNHHGYDHIWIPETGAIVPLKEFPHQGYRMA